MKKNSMIYQTILVCFLSFGLHAGFALAEGAGDAKSGCDCSKCEECACDSEHCAKPKSGDASCGEGCECKGCGDKGETCKCNHGDHSHGSKENVGCDKPECKDGTCKCDRDEKCKDCKDSCKCHS